MQDGQLIEYVADRLEEMSSADMTTAERTSYDLASDAMIELTRRHVKAEVDYDGS